ncbi:DUF3068 domain-containing protein [Spiractinospora alimapuensis]|uniref:porin PorA family protein n=1 Tax=Spiractinospora alimapuensis TaxID=2820884 RepID=UPI001F272E1F|nr:porin PorA family protein [Spiractinospora alimapuensis]QVQ54297.1 DUF3068 domain-containing protein [Spiractinospora alimapuensis]
MSAGPASRGVAAARRHAAVLLVGLGAFLAALAILLRTYVYAQLALLPGTVTDQVVLEDEAAEYLDTTQWETVEDVSVVRTEEVLAQQSPGNAGWSVWWVQSGTEAEERPVDHVDRRVVVDRADGTAINCCGEHVNGDRAVRQAGLTLYWPPGAAPEDHPYYDADIRAAPAMRYEGVEEIGGIETRRYVQTIEATQLPDSVRSVPAEVLGEDGDGVVDAARWLDLTRTVWVEPESGLPVHREERRREALRGVDGRGEVVLLSADLETPPAQVTANADHARQRATLLRATQSWIPGLLLVLSPPLVTLGLIRYRRSRALDAANDPEARTVSDPDAAPDSANGAGRTGD